MEAVWEIPSLLTSEYFGANVQNWDIEEAFYKEFKKIFFEFLQTEFLFSEDNKLLTDFLKSRFSHRLGRYYETIWEFIFMHHPRVTSLKRGLALRDKKSTLGEFDFLWFDTNREEVNHLEVAIKYYLYFPDKELFVGPNFQDRLDYKLEKLQRQIHLSELEQAKEFLQDHLRINPKAIRKNLLIQGKLFYPHGFDPSGINYLNPNHQFSFYYYFKEWKDRKSGQDLSGSTNNRNQYMIQPRLEWLSDPTSNDWKNRGKNIQENIHELQTRHDKGELGILVSELDENGTLNRFFVLPDSIPQFP
ncbi:MAG: DUF1853 family protein [Leptospira sp.]|nr:DUF1853 family protein [Leptospira sp.]